MIYLDNAATTFPKPTSAIRELNFCLKKYCGNAGRSSHRLSQKSAEAIYETRERVARLLSVNTPEQIVFTYNATYALNIAIKSFISEKCHILTSDIEHNSVIRPLESLRRSVGIEYSLFNVDGDIRESLRKNMRADTKGIVCTMASNLTGHSLSLKELSDFARENSLFLIIDGSAAVGHIDIDLTKTPCDAFCAPGHKALFGIQGSGFIWFRSKERRESVIEGGSGYNSLDSEMPILLPEGYEAGTLSTPAIVSLGAGVEFVNKTGIDRIQAKLCDLTDLARGGLLEIPDVITYREGVGIISFNIGNLPSSLVADELDKRGICVRGGLHCAPSVHRKLGTLDRGAVRASFSYFNKPSDIKKLCSAVREIVSGK